MGFDLLPSSPHRYILERQRDKPGAAVWLLRSLPSRAMLALSRLAEDDQAAAIVAIVELGLIGFEGVTRDGQPVAFQEAGRRQVRGIDVSGGAAPELVDLLPVDVITELSGELMRINTLDVESAGNS